MFVGVVVWGMFILQNSTLTSLDESRKLPLINGIVSAGRIGVLLALVWLANWQPVVMSTVVVGGASVVFMRLMIGRIVERRSATSPLACGLKATRRLRS